MSEFQKRLQRALNGEAVLTEEERTQIRSFLTTEEVDEAFPEEPEVGFGFQFGIK